MSENARRYRAYAGTALRQLRHRRGLSQRELAMSLGISIPYLSQIEHDARPLTPQVMAALATAFPGDWVDEGDDPTARRLAALREVLADPIFAESVDESVVERLAEQQPAMSDRFVALHEAYRRAGERLLAMDDAISAGGGTQHLPWEQVRDWFHEAGNYVDTLDRAAEALGNQLLRVGEAIDDTMLERTLRESWGVSISYHASTTIREFDAEMGHLMLDAGLPPESRRFQLALQLASLALSHEISIIVTQCRLNNAAARQLLAAGLANYAAGALLMPYTRFARTARQVRHDIDHLRTTFGVSFEQACHRLSTLQRPGARGIPFFFCRVDMAGNITKRHSATRLQFARFGGACPLWIVHEAVAIPDRILVQLAEMPDGVRYVSMAKGLVKPTNRFDRAPRRYAVALGCEAEHARDFIYADGLDLTADRTTTRIGISCRVCPRQDCDQRAFPSSDRPIHVDPDRRGVVPYSIE